MTKSIKNILIISTLFLLMLGVIGTASADPYRYDNATAFLDNITNLQNNSVVTINCSQANVSQNYTINASNITIQAINGQVTFQSNTSNIHFIINGNNVTLTGINFKNFNSSNLEGGAIYWNGGNGTINQCNFNNNTAQYGGAISIKTMVESWNMNNCTFTQNTAIRGGAIYIKNGIKSWKMNNCTFTENNASQHSGAIYVYASVESWNMTNCTFKENNAILYGGAIYVYASVGSWNMNNCTITENTAMYGGAFYISSVGNWTQYNCTFTENRANTGGVINIEQTAGNWTQYNCTFTENTAKYSGGAIYSSRIVNWYMTDCAFNENTANYGGAFLCAVQLTLNMNNCTFTNNTAQYAGGAIQTYGNVGNWTQTKCTFTNNIAISESGGAIYNQYKVSSWNMTDCQFSDNYAMGLKQDIFNRGEITLTGNTQAIIYNAGIINNKINLIILDNQTKSVPTNSRILLTAQLLVGNYSILGIGFQFIIRNQTITGVISNDQYTAEYQTNITPEEVLVNGSYLLSNNLTYYTALLIVKNSVEITSGLITIPYSKKNNTIILNVTSNGVNVDNGTVTVTINGIGGIFSGEVRDGKANITLPHLNTDVYTLKATYTGNSYYMDANSTITLYVANGNGTVEDTTTNVTVESISGGVILYIYTTTVSGNPADGYAVVLVNGSYSYTTLVKDGKGKICINDLPTGHYNATVTFNSTGDYGVSYNSCSFDINTTPTPTPTGYNLTAGNVYKEFENATQYHAILTDSNGNPIANKTISIAISSAKWSKDALYWITTNKDGIATLTINLSPNEYVITALYGDEIAINNITVIPSNLKLQASNLVKYFMNGTQYTVKVTDVNGNPVANRTVTISIYKSTWKSPVKYYAKTNSDGIATLDINLIAGSYSVTANICYNSTKSSITVLPTLTAESITKKVNKAGSLKAKLVDGQGNPAIGKDVTFTVGYNTYTFTTNYEGIATLPIHLHVGTWSFLISYPDTGASTRATVKVIK